MAIKKVVTGEAWNTETKKVEEQWEIQATGKDVGELRSMLQETANRSHQKNMSDIAKAGWDYISDPTGKREKVRADAVEALRKQGWGQVATRPTFSINGFGTKQKGKPGRTRYKWNPETGEMEEVSSSAK